MRRLKILKEYSIVIFLVLFQIMVIGFIVTYSMELTAVQWWMLLGIIAISVVIDIWMYLSIGKIKEKTRMEIQIATMRKEQELEKRSLEIEQMNMQLLEEKREAFLKALDRLYQLCETEGETDVLKNAYVDTERCLTNMRLLKYCDSSIANAVLTIKYEEAKQNDIKMQIAIDELRENMGIDRVDICSLMSNLLDNAIEACKKVSNNREIHMHSSIKGGYLTVIVENSCVGNVKKSSSGFLSTKQNPKEHGYGTKIIQAIVEKYDGRFYLEAESNFAKAVVLLKIV